MAVAAQRKRAAKGSPASASKSAAKSLTREEMRNAALEKANRRRREIANLKRDARDGRLGPAALLADPRARPVKVLTVLSMVRGSSLEAALDALLACGVNGARPCGKLSDATRRSLSDALPQIGKGITPPPILAMHRRPEEVDRELDRVLRATRQAVPPVELTPSEFAAARSGLEVDPQLLRMIDRLVDAVRLYGDRDDGGLRARLVAEQWILFRVYRAKVASGEYPLPTQRGPAVLE